MVKTRSIPLFYPHIPKSTIRDLAKVLRTKWIGQGPQVDLFEQRIGRKFHLRYPIMTNSGTSALELAYALLDIRKGDEVITPVLTCTASNIPLLRRGAVLKFADIDLNTLCTTNEIVGKMVTARTKAIVGVSLGGIKCDLSGFNIPVVIDAAQAMGHNNGDYIIYSFQAIKHFTTADGGLLNTPNRERYVLAKKLRWFGIDREQKKRNDWQAFKDREMTFDIEYLGYKYQPTDVSATMGLAGLREYDKILAHRKKIFQYYKRELNGYKGIRVVDGLDNVYWLATLLVPNRDRFAFRMKEAGIETNLVQVRNDIFKIFGGKRENLPNMNYVEDRYISIPLHTHMDLGDAEYIVYHIKKSV